MSETVNVYRKRRQAVAGIALIVVGLAASAVRFVTSDATVNSLYLIVIVSFAAGLTYLVKAWNA